MIIPSHIAIILDGNGRWAKAQNKIRTYGHKVGFDKVKSISIYANKIGVKALSLYCFSTENWSRPLKEVEFLMKIPIDFEKDIDMYLNENIKVIVSGRKDRIPKPTLASVNKLIEKTKNCTGMVLNLCFDYGALYDLYGAINYLVENNIKLKDEKDIYNYLWTKDLPMIDLMIRPGKEKRLSNFLLLENAYSELYFTDKYWPEFENEDLDEAILDFNKRNRRFGGIKE
ncbi:MAG: di-trans,poly-cis-decaprenylcistransferase [Gammaproteobacteria bacterium]|nr:di-trans,poly-cis-decaprenylcistransferase [Gammaproteobacteria bacterium]